MDGITSSSSPEVTLCDICGVEGFSEFLTVCTRCNERAEHIYCVQAFCDALPPSWVCEGCKLTSCEERDGKSVVNIDCNQTAQTLHEAMSQNEQCTSEQKQREVEESLFSKGRLNDDSSLLASSVLQVGTSSNMSIDNALCGPTDGKSIPYQEQEDVKKLHHGTKVTSSSKLPASSASKSKQSEQGPSFLLSSKPKTFPRNKSTCGPLAHVGANNKAEQQKGKPKHIKETNDQHLRKAISSSIFGAHPDSDQYLRKELSSSILGAHPDSDQYLRKEISSSILGAHPDSDQYLRKEIRSSILGAQPDSENRPMKEIECFAHGNHTHADVSEQTRIHSLPEKQPNFSSGAFMNHGPRFPFPNYPRPLGSERQQPHFLEPYQGRLFRQHEPVMQHILSQMPYNYHAQNVSSHVPAIPHVQKLWRGSFNVYLDENSSKVFKGIQGHPSTKADEKVWDAARSLPRLLKVKELQRRLDDNTWPEGFSLNPPNSESVGLFFFPVDMESHDSWYKPLVDRMIAYDLMLRAESAFLYLLIFHSRLFPEGDQLWDGRHYLWGMFRPKKRTVMQRATVLQSVQDASDNAEVVDMDIDSNYIQPCTKMSEELPCPPLPPDSPPAEPPPPSPQQCHEVDDSATKKHLAVLQEGACIISHHKSDSEQKRAVPDAVRGTMGTRKKSRSQSVQDGSVNAEVVDMDIDSNDVQPCTKMSEELPCPPLPPDSPPAEPPPPPPQQCHEVDDSATKKHLAVLQEGACMTGHHKSDSDQKHAVPESVRETMSTCKNSLLEHRESNLVDVLLNAAESKVERMYKGQDFKAEGQNWSDTCVDDSLRSTVDNGSQGSQGGDSPSSSIVFKESIQMAAMESDEGTTSMSELQHSACILQPIQLPVLTSVDTSAMSASKTKSKGGPARSPSRHDNLNGSSSCTSLQPGNKKLSNALERESEEAELCVATENCPAGHASSKGDGTIALVQDEVCVFSNARADNTPHLMSDDIGKGHCDMNVAWDVNGCQGVACLPLFPLRECSPSYDTTGVLADLVYEGGHLGGDLNCQELTLVQQLDKPWYVPHASLDSVTTEQQTVSLDLNADLTLLFPQYRKHGNIWIKVDSDMRPCFDKNVDLTLGV